MKELDDDFLDKGSELGSDLDDDFGSYSDFGESQAPMEKHNDLLKSLTDFDVYLKIMVSEWLGMTWDEDKQQYTRDINIQPIMNIKGARWCINQMRVYARNNNIITNLDKDTFKFIIIDVIETVYLNLGARAEEFGIYTDGDILLVGNQLVHTAIMILIGTGGKDNYKDLLQATVSRHDNVSNQPFREEKKENAGWLEKARAMLK